MGKRVLLCSLSILLMVGCAHQLAQRRARGIRAPALAEGATYVGSKECLECHDGLASDARHNVHMRIAAHEAPGSTRGCEACHGPGSAHVEADGDPGKILRFDPEGLEAEEVSAVCLACHRGAQQMYWEGSAHYEADVVCTACHKVHGNSNRHLLVQAGEFRLCGTCHADIRAKGYFMSHHPVREGRMGCSDCHNPHGGTGSTSGMLAAEGRPNELCLSCHTRYQGPFVFEHDPVVEDCGICHDPHGTVANNLLRQNEPFLCLQCHESHFHATRLSNDAGTYGYPGAVRTPEAEPLRGTAEDPGPPTVTVKDHGWQRAFLTKCTTCHQYVHGSDLPSQSQPGRGKMFTR